ncbi:MAG: aminotransferase class V-fold PLP-dependent enzyme [Eubacterium sp.]|nr:aminotransferase class V-fold PLP-dependent enzyme [Eubacterium sp.]
MIEKQLEKLRQDFPILDIKVNNRPLVYLDNAATMQMPSAVMDRLQSFYTTSNANIHRGIHSLSEQSTKDYEAVRKKVSVFLGAESSEEIIFTSGTTAAINMVAGMVSEQLQTGDEIVITQMEHHSNFIPWQQLAQKKGVKLNVVPVDCNGVLNMECFHRMVNGKTRIVAMTELSNLTGIENPVEEMTAYVRDHSAAYVLIDGAQGVVHCRRNMSVLRPDFYCFSGHKLGAPTGTGILYIRKEVQSQLSPAWYGGGTVTSVSADKIGFLNGPAVFEPGTPNYAGVVGLGEVLDYWMNKELEMISEQYPKGWLSWECELLTYLEFGLQALDGVRILGTTDHRKGCVSVCAAGIHAFDFCKFLDQYGIAARSGHHCAMPYLQAMGAEYAVRFSVAPYNTMDEMDAAIWACDQTIKLLNGQREHGYKRSRKRHFE